MWIQAIAIILPRVQQHYSGGLPTPLPHSTPSLMPCTLTVPDNYIGSLSSSMFAGMMIGAVGWGTCRHLIIHPLIYVLQLNHTFTFCRLRSPGPQRSLQRDSFLHRPLWLFRFVCKQLRNSMYRVVPARQCRRCTCHHLHHSMLHNH